MIDKHQIAQKMKTAQCRVHGERATITVKDDHIEMTGCCCEDFQKRLLKMSADEAGEQFADQTINALTNIFKQ